METDRRGLEEGFHRAMLEIYERAREEAGYTPTRFLQLVRAEGGVAAGLQLLEDPVAVSEGFTQLALKGRLDLTVEALMLRDPWNRLFPEEKLKIARRRLK